MDLAKTGKFIQERRKEKNLTQVELAKIIHVSEKTISKWECGNGFPDTSLMLPLCNALEITANELLSGTLLQTEKDYKKNAEQNLVVLKNQQEQNTKHLFATEWALMWISISTLLLCCVLASYLEIATVWRVLIIVFGFINTVIGIIFGILIETKAGFYKCNHCNHKFIPTYNQVLWSMHMGRTRLMKCPKCNKKSWCKKTINND